MTNPGLTIKQLTDAVDGKVTPRMVRHYHQVGLLPQPTRSSSNYRLYTNQDVQRLQRIVALKQQGFQLEHIRKLLELKPDADHAETLMTQLQHQYRAVIQQIAQLRQTASALERLLGRDRTCQTAQAEALSQLKLLEVQTSTELGSLETLWTNLDAQVHTHPEAFQESLQRLMPDLSDRSEIEVDLLSRLVLACGDVSIVSSIKIGAGAIAASREALKGGCAIVTDIPTVTAALDQPRLAHLGCPVETLIANPHITSVIEAEQEFWQHPNWQEKLQHLAKGCILVIGYAPSVLLSVCDAVASQMIQPALIIGMPVGFSHAPTAKRKLMSLGVPYIAIAGNLGGGLLAATALNSLAESLIAKPDCHCYLGLTSGQGKVSAG